jgi:hypothetical protein
VKVSDLIDLLKQCPQDNRVVIDLKQPSVGARACVDISIIESNGIDWDSGKTTICTEKPVVNVEHLERIQKYARRYEKLLYLYSMENNLEFMGKPLMGSKMCTKGGFAREAKRMAGEDAQEYLDGGSK